jgi:hypothetical protein
MNKKSLLNEKEAEVGINLQQPQDLINKAAQPARLVEGNGSSEAAELQEKMKEAAEKFVDLIGDFIVSKYEPKTCDLSYLALANKVFGPRVYCTPSAVLLRFKGGWVRLTTEYVAEAAGPFPPSFNATKYVDDYLTLARMVCKKRGQVGWVLPRIHKEGGALV